MSFLKIRIPCIDSELIEKSVLYIEKKTAQLKQYRKKIVPVQNIINTVLAREFQLNIDSLMEISDKKNIPTDLSQLAFNNTTLRFSSRWNKTVMIQERIFQMSDAFQPLGKYITDTQNGYSPECSESASLLQVLGIDAIQKNTSLSFDKPKFSDFQLNNIEAYTIQDGDFFISRGNTTDLVALASIANIGDDMEPTIFPDLMIKFLLQVR